MCESQGSRASIFEQADRIDRQRKKLDFVLDAIAQTNELELSANGTYGLFSIIQEASDTLKNIEQVLRGSIQEGNIQKIA